MHKHSVGNKRLLGSTPVFSQLTAVYICICRSLWTSCNTTTQQQHATQSCVQ